MRLQYGIAMNLALLACLSSFMLALGQSTVYLYLPILTFIAAILSVYFTDMKGVIRLGGAVSNILVILIVLLSLGDLVRTRAELLAVGIARVLVLVQIVLLFREKGTRERWHILMLSFLQVVVASVFQQSMFYGFLLLVYCFTGLCAFSLIFLQSENNYFKRHSFVKPLIAIRKEEFSEKQDYRRLFKIMVATFLAGPLSLILHYRSSTREEREAESPEFDLKSEAAWEESEDAEGEAPLPSLAFTEDKTTAHTRWPLLHSRPQFSAGTTRKTGQLGGQWELLSRLAVGTLYSLAFGVLLFLLVPRFGGIDIFGMSFSHDRWQGRRPNLRNTVGFDEQVQLGSLGNVSQNYEEVLRVRFTSNGKSKISGELPHFNAPTAKRYDLIHGQFFYLRGVALEKYQRGRWFRQAMSPPARAETPAPSFYPFETPAIVSPRINPPDTPKYLPGDYVPKEIVPDFFFQDESELVSLHCTVFPLNTKIMFAVWPVFQSRGAFDRYPLEENRLVRADSRIRTSRAVFHTTAFYNGHQIEIIPNQEGYLDHSALLQFPEDDLPSLATLAKKWDEESGLPKSDIIARARNLESRLLNDPRFSYVLGGTLREEGTDPLEDFIKNNPNGHCEYFAGALAMMLRSIGIPSRIINGYKSVAESEGERGYAVRQCDAHSWVEAFIPANNLPSDLRRGKYADWWKTGAWVRLDPTPLSEETFMDNLPTFSKILYWVKTFWDQNILNMSPNRQSEMVYQPIRDLFTYAKDNILRIEFWKAMIRAIWERYAEIFHSIRQGNWHRTDLVMLGLPLFIVLAIGYTTFRLFFPGFRRFFRGVINEDERKRLATIGFYLRMEKFFAKFGLIRRPAETQRQFAARIALFIRANRSPDILEPEIITDNVVFERAGLDISEAFYRIRYGNALLEAPEREKVEKALDLLERNAEGIQRPH